MIRKPDNKSIIEIIHMVDRDEICLPDFQRELVWSPKQMAKLIESIIRQYPIGILIFLNAKIEHTFGKRSFRETKRFDPKYYVIDGQQRIDTIWKFLKYPSNFEPHDTLESKTDEPKYRGKNYKIYFDISQDINRLPSDTDKYDFIRAEITENDEKTNYSYQGENKIIPVEFIMNKRFVNKWFKNALKNVSIRTKNRYKRNITNARNRIKSYLCNVEIVKDKLSPEDHYNIFQLLNTAGTELTLFDLLVAKLNPLGIDLRRMWKESKKDFHTIEEYDIDPTYLLRIVSLIGDEKDKIETPTCTQKDLKLLYERYEKDLEGKRYFKEDWEDACKYLEKTMHKFKDNYGVYNKKYIPYSPMIITMASIMWWFEKYKDYPQKYKRTFDKKLKKWYLGSILNKSYESRTTNRISEHYKELKKWFSFGSKKVPTAINYRCSKKDITRIIENIESTADARYKAIICIPLMDNRHAKDIYSYEYLHDNKLHDHHVYPKGFLKENGVDIVNEKKTVDNIVNRMLITETTNHEIRKKSPYEYLKSVDKRILKNHRLVKDIVSHKIDFYEFVEKRKEIISNYLYKCLR